jgi:hypothetical protein
MEAELSSETLLLTKLHSVSPDNCFLHIYLLEVIYEIKEDDTVGSVRKHGEMEKQTN